MHTKSIFARHGIPSEVISDNLSQNSSKEYQLFAEQWGFKHITVSPLNPQSNGLAEKSVQTVKSLLTKAKKDKRDPYIALLEYRNTPIDGVGSPAQLLMSRRLRTTIPTTDAQLQPQVINPRLSKKKQSEKQERQEYYYDQHAKPLPSLEQGDRIRVKMGKLWKPGIVKQGAETPRSYWIETDEGREYRRNRKMIIKSPENRPLVIDIADQASEVESETEECPPLYPESKTESREVETNPDQETDSFQRLCH
ncbi:uncharacterized protein K02A2.6-like [Actinia tenebrosa]|uniref:Uncharacterized protein K02A2.6-like n=1 Tax=Actinia tenebrosa TaxID=6105 RepID=A0A6P8ISN9_ACTTE|nr:uncharacterized protein K02A2.6-like [Actinia tenebrosa]